MEFPDDKKCTCKNGVRGKNCFDYHGKESRQPAMKSYDEKIMDWTDKVVDFSVQYKKEREEFGEAKAGLDVLLAGKILDFVERKKNVGYDMACLLLMADEVHAKVAKDLYGRMIRHENRYKALEKIIDGWNSKIMGTQSIMRFCRENEHRG